MNKKPSDSMAKHTGINHKGTDHSSPYPVSRLAPQYELVDLAKQIAEADSKINIKLSAKLKVIAEQIKLLQSQAKQIVEDAHKDQTLHQADCSFKRIPGKIYHLYKKNNGHSYFSMLSPSDWRDQSPHEFIGSYRLENDMGWTLIDENQAENTIDDDVNSVINQLLHVKSLDSK